MLEAAAVDGEELVVEALAAALGPVFRAAPSSSRVAVAMSGGVDSAVALLRAGAARRRDPAPVGRSRGARHRARVLLARRGSSGPEDLSRPRPSPRDARPARRVPAGDRRSVRPRLRAWGDAESVYPVQRRVPVRRTARLRTAAGAGRLATGHYARTVQHKGRLLLARATDPEKDESYMLAVPPSAAPAGLVPARRADEGETRAEAARPGWRQPTAREPGRVLPRRRRLRPFLGRGGVGLTEGQIVDRRGRCSAATTASRLHPRPAARARRRQQRTLYVLRTTPSTHRRRRRGRGARLSQSDRTRPCTFLSLASRPSSATAPPRSRRGRRRRRAPAGELDEPAYGVAPGQTAALYDDDVVVGSGRILAATA